MLGGTPLRGEAQTLLARLQGGDYEGGAEHINLEQELVRSLLAGCRTLVAGYTVKREPFNAQYSAGIENISYAHRCGWAGGPGGRRVAGPDARFQVSMRDRLSPGVCTLAALVAVNGNVMNAEIRRLQIAVVGAR